MFYREIFIHAQCAQVKKIVCFINSIKFDKKNWKKHLLIAVGCVAVGCSSKISKTSDRDMSLSRYRMQKCYNIASTVEKTAKCWLGIHLHF